MMVPKVHAAENNTIKIALVGCGGRGTGAAVNALSTKSGPTKLVAMADVFPNKLNGSYDALKGQFAESPDKIDVADDRKFISFDGYKQAMDCLSPGDVVIMATPPGFRWVHFNYAIDKGLNVFMEKPTTVDGPTTRKMFELADKSVAKNLKVGVGLMCRHCSARQELHDRIKNDEIGDIVLMRAYRAAGPTAHAFALPKPADFSSELLYQIQEFHAFLWASGGAFSDFLIHNIDECCWMKDAWPVEAKGFGGRHYRGDYIDQNFDTYTTEYTFADGSKMMLEGRTVEGCYPEFASYAHGSKGSAVISTSGHSPSALPHLSRPENGQCRSGVALQAARAEPVPVGMGPFGAGDPRGQAVQRMPPRGRGQPGHLDGTPGVPYGSGRDVRSDAGARSRVCAGHRQADDGFARAAVGGLGRQVSCAAAGLE